MIKESTEEFEKRNFWRNRYQNIPNRAKNSATRNANENHISVQKYDLRRISCISPPLENFAHRMVNYAKFSKEKRDRAL